MAANADCSRAPREMPDSQEIPLAERISMPAGGGGALADARLAGRKRRWRGLPRSSRASRPDCTGCGSVGPPDRDASRRKLHSPALPYSRPTADGCGGATRRFVVRCFGADAVIRLFSKVLRGRPTCRVRRVAARPLDRYESCKAATARRGDVGAAPPPRRRGACGAAVERAATGASKNPRRTSCRFGPIAIRMASSGPPPSRTRASARGNPSWGARA